MAASLPWFPFFPKDWLSSQQITQMAPAQRGAFIQLLALAWGEGDADPSLPADDATLSVLSGLASDSLPLVRSQFTERNGRLYNPKLSEVWRDQQERHRKAVEKATKAAQARYKHAPSNRQASHTEPEPKVLKAGRLGSVEPPPAGRSKGEPQRLTDILRIAGVQK